MLKKVIYILKNKMRYEGKKPVETELNRNNY